jgi:hypothetical protein
MTMTKRDMVCITGIVACLCAVGFIVSGCRKYTTAQTEDTTSLVITQTELPYNYGYLYSVVHDEHEYVVFVGAYKGGIGIIHSPKCDCKTENNNDKR